MVGRLVTPIRAAQLIRCSGVSYLNDSLHQRDNRNEHNYGQIAEIFLAS